MARPQIISIGADHVSVDLSVYRDEHKSVTITGGSGDMVMTIAASAKAEPLVEIPATTTIEITPEKISSLTEGTNYLHNIWDVSDPTDPILYASGTFAITSTIAPTGVDHATQWLDGADVSKIVTLTQAEYDAIGTYESDALYVVTA